MKNILIALALFALPLYGKGIQITATGGAPIPTSFSSSNSQSQVMECQGNVAEVLNQTASVIAVGFGTSSATPPFDYNFVPPGPAAGHRIKPRGGIGSFIYIRSAGTAVTSGTVQVACYHEEKP